ncbi:MAG TPA: tetratricopeptide repeat-containing glycosyltransferase family protein [Stellaceae bacterium]|nr:tetratricopeptide repeat-containing glycosyltransferase family protein [Stellaceae bacterium]
MSQSAAFVEEGRRRHRNGRSPDAEFAKALKLYEKGNHAATRRTFERIVAAHPGHAKSLDCLGGIAFEEGDLPRALDYFRRAVAADPQSASSLRNLGVTLNELKMFEEAAEAFRLATRLDPRDAVAFNCLAGCLRALERWDEAVAAAVAAIRLDPNLPEAFENLAVVVKARGEYDKAFHLFQEALRLSPNSYAAWNNFGNLMMIYARTEDAVAAFRRALALKPDMPEIHMNLGTALLQLGEYGEGFREYEYRWQAILKELRRPDGVPRWEGAAEPRTILLHAEQGLGDTLQFCRYAPMVAARGHRVILEVQPELLSLIAFSLGSEAVEVVRLATDYPGMSGLPPVDAHCPLLSLPRIFGTTPQTIPAAPYLRADPAKVAEWRSRLQHLPASDLRVGLVWAGNPRHAYKFDMRSPDARRSIKFAALQPLLEVPGVSFVSLQKGEGAAQLRAAGAGRVYDADPELKTFADTAALVEVLDLVICVDTSVCHLVGGMGRPVWMLSRLDGCWRWLLRRTDSPWYPSMRIFRQRPDRSWERVIEDVRRALVEHVATAPRG